MKKWFYFVQQPMAGLVHTIYNNYRSNTRNTMIEYAYTNTSKIICMNMCNVIGLIIMEQTMRNERVPKFYSSTIMPTLRSTYDRRLVHKTSYEGRKAFLRYSSLAKS